MRNEIYYVPSVCYVLLGVYSCTVQCTPWPVYGKGGGGLAAPPNPLQGADQSPGSSSISDNVVLLGGANTSLCSEMSDIKCAVSERVK
jgi:hypothetical protein